MLFLVKHTLAHEHKHTRTHFLLPIWEFYLILDYNVTKHDTTTFSMADWILPKRRKMMNITDFIGYMLFGEYFKDNLLSQIAFGVDECIEKERERQIN